MCFYRQALFLCLVKILPPPENLELSTIKLTTDNISTYLACNVEYSEFTIHTIEDKTIYTFKATITTSPRLKDIIFDNVSITFGDAIWGVIYESPNTSKAHSTLDYQGYSITSTYFYKEENTTGFNQNDLPHISSLYAHISFIEGNVLAPVEA